MEKKIKKILKETKVTEHVYRAGFFIIALLFVVLLLSIIRQSFFGQIDPEKHVYFEIVLLLLLAVLAEIGVFYFRQQSVIVLMVLGIIISPKFIELAWRFLSASTISFLIPASPPELFGHSEIIEIFAQLGAIVLLFKVGLHSKIEKIFTKENMLTASLGIIVPFLAGYFYASLAGGSFAFSMFVGAALSATSVGVTVAILREMNVLSKKFSDVIIGAAIIDDILALLLLSVVTNLVEIDSGGAVLSVLRTFGIAAVFILGAIVTGKFVIHYMDREEMGARGFLASIAFMLFFSYVAEVIELSAIVGAFLAGVILNKSRHYSLIEEKTYGLEMLFMPIFFISLGILVDISAIVRFFWPILILTLIAFLTKLVACGGASFFSGLGKTESMIVGIGMAPRGEVALIIASIGLSKGILPSSEYSVISAMALLTSFLVPSILSFFVKRIGSES